MQNSEMTRWTLPSNANFFALHKGAIKLYDALTIIAQAIMLFFSVSTLAGIVAAELPQMGYLPTVLAAVVLLFLHYLLHELLRYVAFNFLDNDPDTVSSPAHYLIVLLIVGFMFFLDFQGTTRFFDASAALEQKGEAKTNQYRSDGDKLDARHQREMAQMIVVKRNAITALTALYASDLLRIKYRRTSDADDRAKKVRDYAAKVAERDGKIAQVMQAASTEQTALDARQAAERNRLNNGIDSTVSKIGAAKKENAAQAFRYGWAISAFCLLIIGFATYQATNLRVRAGQKPISRLTIADATGSTVSKLADALADIGQRQSHSLIARFHDWATQNTRELDTLDGAFTLRKRGEASPTLPTRNGNDATDGDDNGGGNRPKTPTPTRPTHGATQPMPGAVATHFMDLTDAQQRAASVSIHAQLGKQTPRWKEKEAPGWKASHKDFKVLLVHLNPRLYEQPTGDWLLHSDDFVGVIGYLNTPNAIFEFKHLKNALEDIKIDVRYALPNQLQAAAKLAQAYFDHKHGNHSTATPPDTIQSDDLQLDGVETVTTLLTPVTTDKTTDDDDAFKHGNTVLRAFKSSFQRELNNIERGNGSRESICKRLAAAEAEFDEAVRTLKVSPKLLVEVCNFHVDFVTPVVAAWRAKSPPTIG